MRTPGTVGRGTRGTAGCPGGARRLRERFVRTALGVAALALPTLAGAQGTPSDPPPLDLNAIQPSSSARPSPADPVLSGLSSDPSVAVATPEDGPAYVVARFLIEYRSEHPDHPEADALMAARTRLGVVPEGYVAPRAGLPRVTMRVGDVVEGAGGVFHASAINAISRAIVAEMTRRGLGGIIVQLHPEDIDEATGADLRAGQRQDLRFIVWTGRVGRVRTLGSGSAAEAADGAAIDSPGGVQARSRAQSPVQAGDLVRKDRLDDFLFRLNRHPGRRVDVALAPGEQPEEVALDYLVAQSKPWSVYAQLSNTGTEETNEWRERFGFTHNQLTGHDDIFRLDYVTGGFDQAHAVLGSYEFPLRSDRLRARFYGSYSQFDASEVGFADETFSGQTWGGGGEAIYTLYQRGPLFLDATGGLRYSNVSVDNELFGESGEQDFLLPYVGLRLDRFTEAMSTTVGLTFEVSALDADRDELDRLGRSAVDEDWTVLRFDAGHSFYLEPILNRGTNGTRGLTLAHEISLSGRGQYAFDNRLIPNEEDVAGGFYSVRGYPESAAAGDTVVIGTLEYRFHVPRVLPVSDPGFVGSRRVGFLGDSFRWAPQAPYGRADWDLILKAFLDAGRTVNSDRLAGEENETLVGTGVGVELQYKQNVSLRVDWGFALSDIEAADDPVDAGDNRVHFSLTVLY